jgi:hypothetical protein
MAVSLGFFLLIYFSPKWNMLITWCMPAVCGYPLGFGKTNPAWKWSLLKIVVYNIYTITHIEWDSYMWDHHSHCWDPCIWNLHV